MVNALDMIWRCAERQNVDPEHVPGSVLASPADSTAFVAGPTDHGVEDHHALGTQEHDTTGLDSWA